MNRIILIGNGFDLAHGLETSYKNFIDGFWENKIKEYKNKQYWNENEMVELVYPKNRNSDGYYKILLKDVNSYSNLSEYLNERKITIKFNNIFLEIISEKSYLQNWVDIEEEYFNQIKLILQGKSPYRGKGKKEILCLNEDFQRIKDELGKYLNNLDKVIHEKSEIENDIFSKCNINDFTKEGTNKLIEEYYSNYLEGCKNEDEKTLELKQSIQDMIGEEIYEDEKEYFKKKIIDNKIPLFKPKELLFLNFNYTQSEKIYNKRNDVIHIHGELTNPENPIIFGYGDETGKEYVEIENLNDNDFLENVKSIKYSETLNYKRLLDFINFDTYQIFIMGHSCGMSDRTLLKTLFEHENCVSIKIRMFKYKNPKGKDIDDFSKISRNMSRHFSDKTLMRDKLVNKEYC
jgi:hypothetical protein